MFISVCFSQVLFVCFCLFIFKVAHVFMRLEGLERHGRFQPVFCIDFGRCILCAHPERKMHRCSLLQKELNTTEVPCRNLRLVFISTYLFVRRNKLLRNNHGDFSLKIFFI